MIKDAMPFHAKDICGIYNHYITQTVITFEEEELSEAEMTQRILAVTKKLPWIVFIENNHVVGYAYASEWKSRCAYKFSVETTVYVHPDYICRGIGRALYQELISRLKQSNLHAAIGGIALPNDASIALHEKFGFEKIGQFKEVGFKFGKWVDVGYWELIF